MRVVVASTYVPFVKGGSTKIVEDLQREFVRRGYETETVMFPFYSKWRQVPEQTMALRLFDLTESAGDGTDLLVTIRYPSYALQHPNKVSWFIHHHRGAYDLWGTEWSGMPDDQEGRHYRDMMHQSDNLYLRECRKVFTNSKVVGDRLRRFNNIEPQAVLYPPLPTDHPFRPGPFGDYIVYPSRMTGIKRQHLAIEAMQYIQRPLRLVIIGRADSPSYEKQLRSQIESLDLQDRVQMLGWVSEEDKARWIAGSCGTLYLAYDEDSYGYVTLEAFHSHKPVITLTDSGGPNEVIRDAHNGFVVAPQPEPLAEAMNRLWLDRQRAAEMGMAANATLDEHCINWDHVIGSMVA